ncbi:MAG: hypothetical protein MK171_07995 [Pirellulales bacterium]|nr:hypothetical protein [Pirellulales bacterium]
MSANMLPLTTIEKIAIKLEDDIRQRNVRPGDRYLTASEASNNRLQGSSRRCD